MYLSMYLYTVILYTVYILEAVMWISQLLKVLSQPELWGWLDVILDRDGSVFEKELSGQHVWVLSASAINLERSSQLRIINILNILDTCFDSVNAGVWIP